LHLWSGAIAGAAVVGSRGVSEIAPQPLEGVALVVDLGGSAEAQTPEDWQRGTPALDGVLEQETGDYGGEDEQPAVQCCTERQADQDGGGGIGFQGALDVPFPIQFSQAVLDDCGTGGGKTGDILFGLVANFLVDVFGGVPGYSLDG